MNKILLNFLAAFVATVARGNPIIVSHESYIASERLEIQIMDDVAYFSGDFVFRSAPNADGHMEDSDAMIEVPIWIPSRAKRNEPLEHFLEEFPNSRLAYITDKNRHIVDEVLSLRIFSDDVVVEYETFAPFEFGSDRLPQKWSRRGFICLYFREYIDSSRLREGTRVQLEYSQPLKIEGTKKVLFYVPIFRNLPDGTFESRPEDYEIVISAHPDSYLKVTSDILTQFDKSHNRFTVHPRHEQAIVVEITERANK